MTRPTARFLLIACCLISQLPPTAFAKEPKVKEKEKDIAGLTYMAFQHGSIPSAELLATLAQELHWDNAAAGNLDRMAVHLRFEKVDVRSQPPAATSLAIGFSLRGAPREQGVWLVDPGGWESH